MLAIIVIIAGLIIGWAFSWGDYCRYSLGRCLVTQYGRRCDQMLAKCKTIEDYYKLKESDF